MSDPKRLHDEIFHAILDKGMMIHFVPTSPIGASFAYTVGRTMKGRPEFLVTGVPNQGAAATILNHLAESDDNAPLSHGDLVPWGDGSLKIIRAHPGLLLGAMATFGAVEAMQALWADDQGRYPDTLEGRTPKQPVCEYNNPLNITWDPYGESE